MSNNDSRYLLIIGCSQRKRVDPGLLPAIERYDGVNFRVIRKAHHDGYWPANLDVLILSAKFGLISTETPIPKYDQAMTTTRADELRWAVSSALDEQLENTSYSEIFVNLGEKYQPAIEDSAQLKQMREKARFPSGGIGKKMACMKSWIHSIGEQL